MDIEFKTLEELYKRIRPALYTKKEEMRRSGYPYIEEEDIWNYLKDEKWIKTNNLTLYQMVDDILNIDNAYIDSYLKRKLNKNRRFRYYSSEEDFNEQK